MNLNLNKKSILKKTAVVGLLTFLSRIMGITREFLQVSFLGVGALSDAFIVAFRVPNFFRHIFAEGALSASFVPSIVKEVKEGKVTTANGLMTLAFIVFQSVILFLYLIILFKAEWAVSLIAPGFSPEQAEYTKTFLKILFPFLFFVSGSALFAGSLNAVNHFFAPGFGPVLMNAFYIATLVLCLYFKLTPLALCIGILLAGVAHLVMHFMVYLRYGFSFGAITQDAKRVFKTIIKRFLPCLLGVSIVEVNLFVSAIVASFLPHGSVTLLYYGSRFMNIPLGVFAVAFASIMLSHFSRIVLYAPRRINFYMLESAKFICWMIVPAMLFLMINAGRIYWTMFMYKPNAAAQIVEAQWILIIYAAGLVFFCLNKVLLNIFYSIKDTTSATMIAGAGAIVNLVGDVLGMLLFGTYGIAAAAVASGVAITVLSLYFLHKKHHYTFYANQFGIFFFRYVLNVAVVGMVIVSLWLGVTMSNLNILLDSKLGYWTFAFGLGALTMLLLFVTRKLFGVRLYFLER